MSGARMMELIEQLPVQGATLAQWLSGMREHAVLFLEPEDKVLALQGQLDGLETIVLKFSKMTDGRAFSQAKLLRQRLHYQGHLLAAGTYIIDQLPLMWRCGFDQAVRFAGRDEAEAERLFQLVTDFYQGDVHELRPAFARERCELQR